MAEKPIQLLCAPTDMSYEDKHRPLNLLGKSAHISALTSPSTNTMKILDLPKISLFSQKFFKQNDQLEDPVLWMYEFLTGRSFCVKVDKTTTRDLPISDGVTSG